MTQPRLLFPRQWLEISILSRALCQPSNPPISFNRNAAFLTRWSVNLSATGKQGYLLANSFHIAIICSAFSRVEFLGASSLDDRTSTIGEVPDSSGEGEGKGEGEGEGEGEGNARARVEVLLEVC